MKKFFLKFLAASIVLVSCLFLMKEVLSDDLNLEDISVGKIVAGRGTFWIDQNGDKFKAGVSSKIFEKETISTDEASFVVIEFVDGTKMTLRPNTMVTIEEFYYAGAHFKGKKWTRKPAALISILEGGLRVVTGAIAKDEPDNFKMKTPVALLGVRGTEFAIFLCEDGEICEIEGKQ